MKTIIFYLSVLLLCTVFFVLGLLNRETVEFNYVLAKQEVPLIFVMLASFIVGALLMLFVFGIKVWYWRAKAQNIEKQLAGEIRRRDNDEIRKNFESDNQK